MKHCKWILDMGMTGLMLVLTRVAFTGIALHEWLGLGLYAFFLFHILLNTRVIRAIAGKFADPGCPGRVKLGLVLDGVLLLTVSAMILSGLMISQSVLPGLAADTAGWSDFHHFIAYTNLALFGVHIGLHWPMVMAACRRLFRITRPSKLRTVCTRAAALGMVALGVYSLTKPCILAYYTAPFTVSAQAAALPTELWEQPSDGLVTLLRSQDEGTASQQSEEDLANEGLQDYLSKLTCNGCGRRCPLTSPQCSRGAAKRDAAIAEYKAENAATALPSPTPENTVTPEATPVPEATKSAGDTLTPAATDTPTETAAPETTPPPETETEAVPVLTVSNQPTALNSVSILGLFVTVTYYLLPKRTGKHRR